jgi:hypothetical protein
MEDKTLYVFDMDDTLLETPRLSDVVNVENGEIKTGNENIREYIKKLKGIFSSLFFKEICFGKSNDFIVILNCATNKPLGSEYIDSIQDLDSQKLSKAGLKNSTKKDLLRTIEEKNGVLVLKPFPGFYDAKETIGTIINPEIIPIYKSAKNKMIITGRNEKMRQDIEGRLTELGIGVPNFGLHLFQGGSNGISAYKVKVIEDTIIANGWEEIHFFEDRADWLDKAEKEITEKFPEIKFHKHLVTNIKSKLTL